MDLKERMDRARTVGGLLWVAAGTVLLTIQLLVNDLRPGAVTWILIVAVVLLTGAVGIGHATLTYWTAWAAAVLLAVDLAGAVADRFGAFGHPGVPGVSWGNWSTFVSYTDRLVPGSSRGLATWVAVLATVVEVVLAVLLASGWQRRWVGKAAAGLFVIYAGTMALCIGMGEVARYAVPVLIGGALIVSAVPARRRGRPIEQTAPQEVRL